MFSGLLGLLETYFRLQRHHLRLPDGGHVDGRSGLLVMHHFHTCMSTRSIESVCSLHRPWVLEDDRSPDPVFQIGQRRSGLLLLMSSVRPICEVRLPPQLLTGGWPAVKPAHRFGRSVRSDPALQAFVSLLTFWQMVHHRSPALQVEYNGRCSSAKPLAHSTPHEQQHATDTTEKRDSEDDQVLPSGLEAMCVGQRKAGLTLAALVATVANETVICAALAPR